MSKKTLNTSNLETLGAERLAALLMEVSAGSADIKRRLRLELSHNLGAGELAHDVRKRLVSLRKSSSFVGWRKRKALVKDLSTQVAMIVEKIAPQEPTIAFDLLWQFIEIAPSVYERVDDSRGDVGDVFRNALAGFEDIAPRALLDPDALALRVWLAVEDNGYGEWDGIIALMAQTLGSAGLARLKALVEDYAATPLDDPTDDHEAIHFLRSLREGSHYAAERKALFVRSCLQQIAAVTGDTDAYIAQYSDRDLKRRDIAAKVAMLLLTNDRAEEGMAHLHGADQDGQRSADAAWDDAYIACLIALEQTDKAQAHRWASFTATLNARHLRDYLKLLPDFEDVEAEERARTHILEHASISTALAFCLNWPDLLTAARLVGARVDEIDGNQYFLLTPAAEALRARHPIAAVLLWRKIIDYALGQARSSRYGHAADHLADCALLDAEIADYGAFPTHAEYLQTLQTRHERKASFWAKVR